MVKTNKQYTSIIRIIEVFIKLSPIYILVILLYHPLLTTFFTGDDFFHFKVSLTDGSLSSFVKLFGAYPFEIRSIAFYRPLFREALYNIFYNMFNLNHLPFRLLSLLIHFINIYLVHTFFQKLFKNNLLSFLAALFFGISTANVAILYYLAGGIQALGATMFVLLTLLLFENHKKIAFITFLLGLASHELASATPFLLTGLTSIKQIKPSSSKREIRPVNRVYQLLIPYFVILTIYLFINIFVIGFSKSESQYHLNFNPKTFLNTLMWYSGWALGLPEMLNDFVQSGFSLNSNLMKFWGSYFQIIFPAFFISISIIAVLTIKNFKIILNKKLLFLVLWFLIGLAPVIFLPNHKSTYYLAVSLPAFWATLWYVILKSTKNKFIISLLVITLLTLSVTSIKLSEKTFIHINRGRISQKLLSDFQDKYPQLPKNSVIFIKNDPNYPDISGDWGGSSTQAFYSLSGPDALQLLYNDNSLKVHYEDFSAPEDSDYIEFTAEII